MLKHVAGTIGFFNRLQPVSPGSRGVSTRYQLTDRQFRAKYGMTLEEFEAAGVMAEKGYSYEVENDHQDWELAVDGIRSTERQLADLHSSVSGEKTNG